MTRKLFCGTILAAVLCQLSVRAGIFMGDLPELTLDTIGIQTAFPSTLWQGALEKKEVENLISLVGKRSLTRAQAEVYKQILLTDLDGQYSSDQKEGSFLYTRLEGLLNQGFFEEVLLLIEQVPEAQMTVPLKKIKAEVLFSLNRVKEACHESLIDAFDPEDELFIQSVCAYENGSQSEAELAFDVYREGTPSHFVWGTIAGDQLHRNLAMRHRPKTQEISVWELPFLTAAQVNDWRNFPLSHREWKMLALHTKVDPFIRIEAAEKAELSEEDWHKLLSDSSFESQKIDAEKKSVSANKDLSEQKKKREKSHSKKGDSDPEGEEDKLSNSAMSRLILYHQAKKEVHPQKRLEFVRAYLQSAEKDGVLFSVAPVAMELGYMVEPDQKQLDIAEIVLKVSAYRFELSTAMRWYQLLQQNEKALALRFSAAINALGGGVPETIDPLIQECLKHQNCDQILKGIPFYFSASPKWIVQLPNGLSKGYAGFMTAAIQNQIESGNIGVGLLNGLLLLNSSTEVDRPLIQAMGMVMPKGLSDRLLMEQLLSVYQTNKIH